MKQNTQLRVCSAADLIEFYLETCAIDFCDFRNLEYFINDFVIDLLLGNVTNS